MGFLLRKYNQNVYENDTKNLKRYIKWLKLSNSLDNRNIGICMLIAGIAAIAAYYFVNSITFAILAIIDTAFCLFICMLLKMIGIIEHDNLSDASILLITQSIMKKNLKPEKQHIAGVSLYMAVVSSALVVLSITDITYVIAKIYAIGIFCVYVFLYCAYRRG